MDFLDEELARDGGVDGMGGGRPFSLSESGFAGFLWIFGMGVRAGRDS